MRNKLKLMTCILVVAMLCGCSNKSISNETVTYGAIERAGNYCFKIKPSQFEDLFNENLKDEKNRIGNCKKTDSKDWTNYEYELNENGVLRLFASKNSEYIYEIHFGARDSTEFKEEYADIAVKMIDSSYDFETILDGLLEEGETDSNGNFNSIIYKPFGEHEIMFTLNVFSDTTGDMPTQIFTFSVVPKENILTTGAYEVGIDLDGGSYDIYLKNGSGTCSINDGDLLGEKFSFGTEGISSYQNAKLQEGDTIKISGDVELEFYPNY